MSRNRLPARAPSQLRCGRSSCSSRYDSQAVSHATRRYVFSGLALLLAAGAVGFLILPGRQPANLPGVGITVIHGRSMSLDELRGHPVFVTFWSTTCAVCLRERPLLAKLYRELGPSGLEVVAVAMSYDPPSRVAAVMEREGIPFPVALDIDARVEQAFGGAMATPTSFLFAPDGALVYRRQGASDMEKLRQRILLLLADKPALTSGRIST